ncbi:cytochrome b-245 chaperone 1-like [Gigantopelta aegis]|uniref:cytochrome b-245 chaperone 1-like n=1 Tax=Gigantopelta aegis TaxID=1735272 RepID=UPI001B88A8B3|nr:cytochrome b-245 chaperone 1-like [Gigantopelta aegis]
MGYVTVKEETPDRLCFSREPNIWSWSLFFGAIAFGFGAAYYGSDYLIWKLIYVVGAVYIGIYCMDDWEICEFDKRSGETRTSSCSLLQKFLQPFLKQHTVVANLDDIVGIRVEEESVRFFGNGHQVVLLFATGMSIGITETFTFGNSSEHYQVADKIRLFLDLDHRNQSHDTDDYLGDGSSSEDSFEQINPDDISTNVDES